MLLRITIAAFLIFLLIGGYAWMIPSDDQTEPLNENARAIISNAVCLQQLLKEMPAEQARAICTR